MKRSLQLMFTALCMISSGCANSAAQPTPHPLPPTPDFQQVEFFASSSDIRPVSVTASAYTPDAPPSNAVDGDPETLWNSGGDAEGWIQLDLGAPFTITRIALLVSQYPAGETVHQIWAGPDSNELALAHEFRGATHDSDLLELAVPLSNTRIIKIVTIQSPSWVAWREIHIEAP